MITSAKRMLKISWGVVTLLVLMAGCAPAHQLFTDDSPSADLRPDEASSEFNKKHRRDKHPEEARVNQARVLIDREKYDEARQLLQKVLDQHPDSPREAEALKQIGISYYRQGDYRQTLSSLKKLLTKYPLDGSYEPYFLIAQSLLKLNDHENALAQFQSLAERYPENSDLPEFKYGLGSAAFSLGEDQLAWDNLQAIDAKDFSPPNSINLGLMLARLAECREDYWSAWTKLMLVLEEMQQVRQSQLMTTPDELRTQILELIANNLTPDELSEVKSCYPETFPGGEAILRLAQIAEESLDYDQVRILLAEFLAEFYGHPRYQEAQELNRKIEQSQIAYNDRIGLIIPLTGKFSVYGEMVLRGVELAVEEENREREAKLALIIKDSQGKPNLARQLMLELIIEDRVIGVIGPVLSKSAQIAGDVANRLHTPMITPTAGAQGIPEIGPYVFRNCITSTQQGQAIAQFAMEKMCLKEFAILYPKSPYGVEFKDIFSAYVDQLGGKILGLATYEKGETDFRWQAEYLGSTEPEAIFIPDYADKVVLIAPQLAFYAPRKSPEDLPPDVLLDEGESKQEKEEQQRLLAAELKGETTSEWWMESGGIESLPPAIIPHRKNPLAAEAATLPEEQTPDVPKVILLGTNGWYSPVLVKEGGKFVERAVFPTGFYNNSPSPAVQNFIKLFKERFWQTPNLLSAQAYDAARILISALEEASDRNGLQQTLLNTQDFPGVSGRTSFNPEGDSEKELFIMGIKAGRLRQLDGNEEWLCPIPPDLD